MQVRRFETREDWEQARLGKITGSKLADLISKRDPGKKKIGFYALIAERLAIPDDGTLSAMEHGNHFQEQALIRFQEESNLQLNTGLVLWVREDNENIAVSPDGFTEDLRFAVEVKCLSSARHIEALVTGAIPKDYWEQVMQYMAVNERLERLYFVFFDPRLLCKQFFYYEVSREDHLDEIREMVELEKQIISEVNEIASSLMEL